MAVPLALLQRGQCDYEFGADGLRLVEYRSHFTRNEHLDNQRDPSEIIASLASSFNVEPST